MKIITERELTYGLFDHPYDQSPDYHAAMSVVYMSDDRRMMIGYWHAPVGEVSIPYGGMVEHIQILQGRVTLFNGVREVEAVSGDIIRCGGDHRTIQFRIREYVKALFIVYPQSEQDAKHVCEMMDGGGKPLFSLL